MIEPITATQMQREYAWVCATPVERLLTKYAIANNVTVADLLGRSRKQPLARIRQDCMARMQYELGFSMAKIGRVFNRDHTTVMHAIKRSEERQVENHWWEVRL